MLCAFYGCAGLTVNYNNIPFVIVPLNKVNLRRLVKRRVITNACNELT